MAKKKSKVKKAPVGMSRQRAWQLAHAKLGLCQLCSEPAWREGAVHCPEHRARWNDSRRARAQAIIDSGRKRA